MMLNPFALELEHHLGLEEEERPANAVGAAPAEKKVYRAQAAIGRAVVRSLLLGASLAVALLVPFFGDVMSFVGAACLTMMVFVLPVALSWRLRADQIGWLEGLWGLLIVATGLTAGGVGTYQAVVSIAQKLQHGDA